MIFVSEQSFHEYYPQRTVGSVLFLANPVRQMYFFNSPSVYVYYLVLVIFSFLKFAFSPEYCKCAIVTGVSYGTWNSRSVTFFENKHD